MYRVEDHGSVMIVRPMGPEAMAWIEENVEDPQWFAGGMVVEPRYLGELLAGMDQDLGLAEEEARMREEVL